MNKKTMAGGLIIISLAIVFFGIHYYRHTNDRLSRDHKVTIQDKTFTVRIADTQKTQTLGLSYSRSLPKNEGMLFIFTQPAYYAFWMKKMKYPLDVVWLKKTSDLMQGANYIVIGFEKNVSPNTYPESFTSPKPADAFLELPAGTIDELHQSVIGTLIHFQFSNI